MHAHQISEAMLWWDEKAIKAKVRIERQEWLACFACFARLSLHANKAGKARNAIAANYPSPYLKS